MKNKGFTLIELLGGILILTVIALITIPIISGVVNKARLNALKDSAYGLIDASELYYAQFGVSSNTRFDIDDNKVLSNDVEEDKMLSYRGSIKEGTVIINKKGQITVCITDGKNAAYKNYTEKEVTLVSKKTCNIPSNSNIVYLDNDRTLEELTNLELTQRLLALEESKIDLDDVYPVGSIYISVDDTNPSGKFGGTWVRYAEGKTLVGVNGEDNVEQTGGHKSVNLTTANIPSLSVSGTTASTGSGYSIGYGSAARTVSSWSGSHSHSITNQVDNYAGNRILVGTGSATLFYQNDNSVSTHPTTITVSGQTVADYYANSITGVGAHTHTFTGTYTNSSQAKVNVQDPYITVYMWKRTA